jgi:uncharacterized membrane protein required for colicin V production
MQISESYITFLNVTFILLLIGFGVYGYFRGLFKQSLDVVSMLVVAWLSTLLGPLFAKNVNLVGDLNIGEMTVVSNIVSTLFNSTVWIIVLFIVLMILVGIVRIIAFKHIKTPLNKNVDRYGGVALSIVIPVVIGILIVSILSLPVFANGKDIVSASLLSPLSPIGDSVSQSIVSSVDPDGLLEKIAEGEELNEDDTESLIDVLIRMGIPQEIATIVAKAYTGTEVTQDDMSKVKTWIMSKGYSEEDIRNMMREVGLSEEEIEEIMNEYNN